ncbi:MAG: hypothetical protein H6983_14805 [Ectothiorhodospiraceae bacterium]|nr:hypothetical protein [Ectothiorhodospiraceae bacterium]
MTNASTLSRDTLARLPMAVLLSDAADHVVWVNDAFCTLLAAPPESLVGAPVEAVLTGRSEVVAPGLRRFAITADNGRRLWLQCTETTLDEGDGAMTTLRLFDDISSLDGRGNARSAAAFGRTPSRLDGVTGALTRLAVLQELSAQISRSRRYGNRLSVLLVRLAPAAESALELQRRAVAQVLREQLRWVDSTGILTPEEFLVVLPETDARSAGKVARKLSQAITAIEGEAGIGADHANLTVAGWRPEDDMQALLARVRRLDDTPAALGAA